MPSHSCITWQQGGLTPARLLVGVNMLHGMSPSWFGHKMKSSGLLSTSLRAKMRLGYNYGNKLCRIEEWCLGLDEVKEHMDCSNLKVPC